MMYNLLEYKVKSA